MCSSVTVSGSAREVRLAKASSERADGHTLLLQEAAYLHLQPHSCLTDLDNFVVENSVLV